MAPLVVNVDVPRLKAAGYTDREVEIAKAIAQSTAAELERHYRANGLLRDDDSCDGHCDDHDQGSDSTAYRRKPRAGFGAITKETK